MSVRRRHVRGGRAASVDDIVGMDVRYDRAAYPCPFESGLIDQTSGCCTGWVLERRATRRAAGRFGASGRRDRRHLGAQFGTIAALKSGNARLAQPDVSSRDAHAEQPRQWPAA